MNDGTIKSSMRHLSMLGAWALAFGCAVGSDAFVMPWNDFLPKAGPLGTVLGICIGSQDSPSDRAYNAVTMKQRP